MHGRRGALWAGKNGGRWATESGQADPVDTSVEPSPTPSAVPGSSDRCPPSAVRPSRCRDRGGREQGPERTRPSRRVRFLRRRGRRVPSVGSQRLLAFLAIRDQVTTRNQVAGTLWPESTDQHAGASLRSAVSRLDGLARQAVKVTANDLGLAEGVSVDVHLSQALARRLIDRDGERSEVDIAGAAVSALSDDLLPGWYDDWAIIAAEDWRQLRLHALEAVASRLTEADRLAEAAAAALAAVRAEPLRESARAALIRVHMAEGNQSEALGEFERYRVLLRAELDIEPTTRLSQLLGGLEPR